MIFLFSCRNHLIDEKHDDKETKKFIRQLIKKEKEIQQEKSFINSICILEHPEWRSFDNEFKLKIQKELGIENKAFLELQIDLFNKFKITKELTPQKNIITDQEYIQFNESFNKNEFAYLDWLDKMNCQQGFSSISKPLFNENYDLAIVRFEKICEPLCGGGLLALYEITKGKWKQKKILDSWIH